MPKREAVTVPATSDAIARREAAKAERQAWLRARHEEVGAAKSAGSIGPLYDLGAAQGWDNGFDEGWAAALADRVAAVARARNRGGQEAVMQLTDGGYLAHADERCRNLGHCYCGLWETLELFRDDWASRADALAKEEPRP